MRYSGTLRSWNDERGFGFIAQADGRPDLFLHISELPRDGTRPAVGEKLTYALGRGNNGKPQAVNVVRQAIGDTRNYQRTPPPRYVRKSSSFSKTIVLVILLALGAYGYKHYQQAASKYQQATPLYSPAPTPAPAQLQQEPLQDSSAVGFKCDGRTYCSQMTSCTEAKLFLKNCPGVAMDGNHDGVPCEQQWCTNPFSK